MADFQVVHNKAAHIILDLSQRTPASVALARLYWKTLAAAEQRIVQLLRTSQLSTSLRILIRHVLKAIFITIILGLETILISLPLSGDWGIGPLLIFVEREELT